MLQMAACLVGLAKHAPDPSTPSAMVPTYKKKSKRKRSNKRGAKTGHPGKRRDAFFAFLDYEDVPPDNNHAEREIRPAVLIRKNSLRNQSERGADVQAILMSIYRTLNLRGIDPLEAIVSALREYVRTGSLPRLPGDHDTDG